MFICLLLCWHLCFRCEWAADYHGDTPHLMNYNTFPTTERKWIVYTLINWVQYLFTHTFFNALFIIFFKFCVEQEHFALNYLQTTAALQGDGKETTTQDISDLIQEVKHFEQLSHLWWGIWGLLQATQSTIDFDYIGYGKCRLDELEKLLQKEDALNKA